MTIASLGGGGGSFATLSDKATADLPATNTPLATALAAKATLGHTGRATDVTTGRALAAADSVAAGAGIVPLNAGTVQAFTIPTAATMGVSGAGNMFILQCLGAAHTVQTTGGATLNSGVLTVTSNTVTLVVGNTYVFQQRGSTDVWDCN
jgi:hypothetical protein